MIAEGISVTDKISVHVYMGTARVSNIHTHTHTNTRNVRELVFFKVSRGTEQVKVLEL